jgi:choline kinase
MAVTRVAVILVAGIGSRLRPLTDDRPKALVQIGSETILGRAVRLLHAHGVERIVLATGYREDAVRRALEGAPVELAFCPNPRFDVTQNSVSLWECEREVRGASCFKLDGDVVFQPEVLERLDASAAPLAMAVDRTRRTDAEAMKFRADDAGRILELGKHLPLDRASGESIGIERMSREAVATVFDGLGAAVARGRTDLYYEDVYSELIAAGRLAAGAVDVGDLPWTEIDDHADLARARTLLGA